MDLPHCHLELAVKKPKYFQYVLDVDESATKGASVGSPMYVLKAGSGWAALGQSHVWLQHTEPGWGQPTQNPSQKALRSVIGDEILLFEDRKSRSFHVVCLDISVDSRIALCIRNKQVTALDEEDSEVDWGEIVDERVLKACGCVSAGVTGSCVPVSSKNSLTRCQRLPHTCFAFERDVNHDLMSR